MGIPCCCCNAKNSKRAAEPHKRAAGCDPRYREEIDPRRKIDDLRIAANRYEYNIKDTQGQISYMYDQIKVLLAKKGVHDQENANDLARQIVGKEEHLKHLRFHKQYCETLAQELETNQLASDLKNIMAKVSQYLEKGLIDGEGLTDELYKNEVLIRRHEDRRREIHGQLNDRGDDHKVAEVLRNAQNRDGAYK